MNYLHLLQVLFTTENIVIGLSGTAIISSIGIAINSNFNRRISKKADKEATVRELDNIHAKINLKADKELVTKMSEQVAQIHNKLMK